MSKVSTFIPSSVPGRLDALRADIRKARLRVTEQRVAILAALTEKHGPFTVEEVHNQLTGKSCDLATVYRSFISLERAGLIRRCEFGDGTSRYELAEGENHHHHAICKKCKRIEVLEGCVLTEVNQMADKTGFVEISHVLEFFGICAQCKMT